MSQTMQSNTVLEPVNLWRSVAAAVPGRRHVREGIPCQDAAAAGITPRPYIIACDGRGSADLSHFGAAAAVTAFVDLLYTAETLFQRCLDTDADNELATVLGEMVYRSAGGAQLRLAQRHNCSASAFEHTLVAAIVGRRRILTVHVGDGDLVGEMADGQLRVLSAAANGEFANQTSFVQARGTPSAALRIQLLDAAEVRALAVFSDGVSAKMLHYQTQQPTPGFKQLFGEMRANRFARRQLLHFLTETNWEPSVQDDRCLAAIAAQTGDSPAPIAATAAATAAADAVDAVDAAGAVDAAAAADSAPETTSAAAVGTVSAAMAVSTEEPSCWETSRQTASSTTPPRNLLSRLVAVLTVPVSAAAATLLVALLLLALQIYAIATAAAPVRIVIDSPGIVVADQSHVAADQTCAPVTTVAVAPEPPPPMDNTSRSVADAEAELTDSAPDSHTAADLQQRQFAHPIGDSADQ